jgi:hypothetical protein
MRVSRTRIGMCDSRPKRSNVVEGERLNYTPRFGSNLLPFGIVSICLGLVLFFCDSLIDEWITLIILMIVIGCSLIALGATLCILGFFFTSQRHTLIVGADRLQISTPGGCAYCTLPYSNIARKRTDEGRESCRSASKSRRVDRATSRFPTPSHLYRP